LFASQNHAGDRHAPRGDFTVGFHKVLREATPSCHCLGYDETILRPTLAFVARYRDANYKSLLLTGIVIPN